MGSFERLAGIPVRIEGACFESLELPGVGFTRRTTVIRLEGQGRTGLGEDVNYDPADQQRFRRSGPRLELSGEFTLATFSDYLGGLDLCPDPLGQAAAGSYRRWAFESAALDLALQQSAVRLSELLERTPRPLRFVASMGLGNPASTARVHALHARVPGLRFKLDAGPQWTGAVVRDLVDLGAVDVIDLKGAYHGTPVDTPPDPELYRMVATAFPQTWIEDPAWTPETERALAGHLDRVTWDAPLHSLADLTGLPRTPRAINVKPSRFGTIESLLEIYDYCATHGIACYGGGQFELGPGRTQIQALASIFHPDSANDVAPVVYHPAEPAEPLPGPVIDPPRFASTAGASTK